MKFISHWNPFSKRGEIHLAYRGRSAAVGEYGRCDPNNAISPELRVKVVERLYFFGVCYATKVVALPLVQETRQGEFWPEVQELKRYVAKHHGWGSKFLEEALWEIRSSELVASSACCVLKLTGRK